MICQSTDVELETIVSRIKNKAINLQPDFQRGKFGARIKRKN